MKRQLALILSLVGITAAGCSTAGKDRRGLCCYPRHGQSDEHYARDSDTCHVQVVNVLSDPDFRARFLPKYPAGVLQLELYEDCMATRGYVPLFAPEGRSLPDVNTDNQECKSKANRAPKDPKRLRAQIMDCLKARGYSPG